MKVTMKLLKGSYNCFFSKQLPDFYRQSNIAHMMIKLILMIMMMMMMMYCFSLLMIYIGIGAFYRGLGASFLGLSHVAIQFPLCKIFMTMRMIVMMMGMMMIYI